MLFFPGKDYFFDRKRKGVTAAAHLVAPGFSGQYGLSRLLECETAAFGSRVHIRYDKSREVVIGKPSVYGTWVHDL